MAFSLVVATVLAIVGLPLMGVGMVIGTTIGICMTSRRGGLPYVTIEEIAYRADHGDPFVILSPWVHDGTRQEMALVEWHEAAEKWKYTVHHAILRRPRNSGDSWEPGSYRLGYRGNQVMLRPFSPTHEEVMA